jgi:WD40 repeat protein
MGDAEIFVGRAGLTEEVRHRAATRRRTVIVGEPGIGKTALIRHLADVLGPVGVHFCSARESSSISPVAFAEKLGSQLSRAVPGFAEALLEAAKGSPVVEIRQTVTASPGANIMGMQVEQIEVRGQSPYQAFDQLVGAPLRALDLAETKLLILVDALDEARRWGTRPNILDLIANSDDLPAQVHWILTSRPVDEVTDLDGSPLVMESLGAENTEDLGAYVKARLATIGLPAPRADSFGSELTSKAEGNFLYATLVLGSLKGRAEGTSLESFLSSVPPGLDPYYTHVLRSLAAAHGTTYWKEIARPILGVLAAAFEPMTSNDLSLTAGLSRQAVRDALSDLQEFFDPTKDGHSYRLFHQTLVEFLSDEARSGRFWIDMQSVHAGVAMRLSALGAAGWHNAPAYATRNVARHLSAAGRANELGQVLLSYDWMHAKLVTDQVQGLVDAYNSSDDRASKLVQSAVRLGAHIIARDFGRLAEQLVARLPGDDPDVEGFVADVRRQHRLPWLRPIRRSLASPSGAERLTLLPKCGAVTSLAISADECWTAIGGHGGTVEVWDIKNGVPVGEFSVSNQPITHVALSPKGSNAAAADTKGHLVLWSVALQRERLRYEPKLAFARLLRVGKGLRALEFLDETTVVAFDPRGVVLHWTERSGGRTPDVVRLSKFRREFAADVKVAAKGKMLAATGHDANLRTWSLTTGKRHSEIQGVSDGLWNNAVAVDVGGTLAITTSHDRLHVWRLQDGRLLATQYIGHFFVGAMVVGDSTSRLYLGGFTGGGGGGSRARSRIEVYDTATLRELKSLVGNVGGVKHLAVGAAEQTAVSSSGEVAVKVWRLQTNTEEEIGDEHDDAQFGAHLNSIVFSGDGSLALCGLDANGVVFFDVPKAAPLRGVAIDDELWYRGPGIGVLDAGLSPNGRYMVAGSGSGKMRIARIREDVLDPAEPPYSPGLSLEGHFDGQFTPVTKVTFLPNGDAATGDGNGEVRVWRVEDGKLLQRIDAGAGKVVGLAVDGRGEALVSACERGGVRWWAVDGFGEIAAFDITQKITSLATLPASDAAIIGCADGSLLYARPGIASPTTAKVGDKALSALAVQGATGLCVWGCESGEIGIATVTAEHLSTTLLRAGGDECTCVSPAPDSTAFISGSAGGELTLWDLDERKAIASFRADSGITTCAIAPGSGVILAGDRSARVHWLTLEGAMVVKHGEVRTDTSSRGHIVSPEG